jgi:hypothetical protein
MSGSARGQMVRARTIVVMSQNAEKRSTFQATIFHLWSWIVPSRRPGAALLKAAV